MRWGFSAVIDVWALLTDPSEAAGLLVGSLCLGFLAGAVAVVLTLMYERRG